MFLPSLQCLTFPPYSDLCHGHRVCVSLKTILNTCPWHHTKQKSYWDKSEKIQPQNKAEISSYRS